ncbi:hypothetical protein EJ06DRAFT_531918 [Trichodelitschia bisporula]|uniref:Uncharacterized protein n=1 Tax=Trichodelitschia bisporula TaxID=703511 RepID=A0A6G1HS64_9PEZI|nr:hypothetical protein EJ06DRAFT_531918 [Trichodelitschia bisporula]
MARSLRRSRCGPASVITKASWKGLEENHDDSEFTPKDAIVVTEADYSNFYASFEPSLDGMVCDGNDERYKDHT